jgi:hypothetical protein
MLGPPHFFGSSRICAEDHTAIENRGSSAWRREEAVQGGIAASGPAARSVASGHPSWRGVTSVHGRGSEGQPSNYKFSRDCSSGIPRSRVRDGVRGECWGRLTYLVLHDAYFGARPRVTQTKGEKLPFGSANRESRASFLSVCRGYYSRDEILPFLFADPTVSSLASLELPSAVRTLAQTRRRKKRTCRIPYSHPVPGFSPECLWDSVAPCENQVVDS